MKQYSEACERNKEPILQILEIAFKEVGSVLEVGSGTGQHGVYFAKNLPHLTWQPSDLKENHSSINAYQKESFLSNLLPPIEINLERAENSLTNYGSAFSANVLHIVSKKLVMNFFKVISKTLDPSAPLCIYGPFNYNGEFSSESNLRFDSWLKERDSESGIRDFEWICELAIGNNLEFSKDHSMPANNRILEFHKKPA